MRLFSCKNRPVHKGPYPTERLARQHDLPDLSNVPAMKPLHFIREEEPECLSNSMFSFMTMLDAIRDGDHAKKQANIPSDISERSNHLKSAGYFFDATQVGICSIPKEALLSKPIKNSNIDQMIKDSENIQPTSFASGVDVIIADVKEAAKKRLKSIHHHIYAIVFLFEYTREPLLSEIGCNWIINTQEERAAVRAGEIAVVLSNYLRIMGYEARAHTATASDVDLNVLTIASGLTELKTKNNRTIVTHPFIGDKYGCAAITTSLDLKPDKPLKKKNLFSKIKTHGPSWWLGRNTIKNVFNKVPYKNRPFFEGAFPFEKVKTQKTPTTLIDENRIPRIPKRADMFSRALFGDMGKKMRDTAKSGYYMLKNPMGYCSRRVVAAYIPLQDGPVSSKISTNSKNPNLNAKAIKASLYYLGADAVGLSKCPKWVYYSHDAMGRPINPYHKNAISILVDQGQETMDGCSGDDWISAAQSMRAYLRTSLIGGIVAEHIRKLGYSARVHSVLDGEVLQPPLLLLSGMGEVSRIGEVILNPHLGPRLKAGVITTNMPFNYDKPINFGLQNFCNNCLKCARECPSGAITAGEKVMFNGYEIWKSDSERCTRYRLTNAAGSMCGRCMKTCPWNLEGVIKEKPFRWLAMHVPKAAKYLTKLDDKLGNGEINNTKKWWWDLELNPQGQYILANKTNRRTLNKDLNIKFEDQTLAVYPASLVPPPYPFPCVMDREKGIAAFKDLLHPRQYKLKVDSGNTENIISTLSYLQNEPPVIEVEVTDVIHETPKIIKYELSSLSNTPLPKFQAGSNIDVMIAPEYFRQFSLAGDPSDNSKYTIGVFREDNGRGGSKLMHRIFKKGRRIFISKPSNHFPLDESATKTLLFGGGIGITPLLSMAHRLHAINKSFSLYYSAKSRKSAGFLKSIESFKWKKSVKYFFSDEGNRANFDNILNNYSKGAHLYICGPGKYISAILESAQKYKWPEEACHFEYFKVPETCDVINNDFVIRLARSNKSLKVPSSKTVSEVLDENGIKVDSKCLDGICGVCSTRYIAGEVEHRDYVLSKKERDEKIIICCSRAVQKEGELVLDL